MIEIASGPTHPDLPQTYQKGWVWVDLLLEYELEMTTHPFYDGLTGQPT